MQVKDIMTRNVISVGPDESIMKAARLMLQNRISGLPVIDKDGELAGIVTEGDFLRRGELGTQRRRPKWLEFIVGPGRLAEEYVHSAGRKVDEIMTTDPVTASEGDTLETVVDLMERRHVKRLPVVNDGRVVGIISRANLMHALASFAREEEQHAERVRPDDSQIHDSILAVLNRQSWAPQINVVVKSGVAELWGVITDDRERKAVVVAVENVPGVVQVHDHLVWVEPTSGIAFSSVEDDPTARTAVF
jgi:CBS domain-containing protein